MITIKTNGSLQLNPQYDFLDCEHFKFAYTDQLFDELGVEYVEGVEPLRGNDPWYLEGNLHGHKVCASYNTHENLTLSAFGKRVSYNVSMKDTLNEFIDTYREGWNEHYQNQRQSKDHM
jgi:hypothetical protein